jgi:tRNA (uracil-5-)-methyltransferase TRM9
VAAFVGEAGARALVADVGCGNGKYAALAPFSLGLDPCAGLLAAAAARPACDAVLAAGPGLPLRGGAFDAVLCVAVVHHLASRARRRALIAAVSSAAKRGGGRALITAWAAPDAQPEGKDRARAARWRGLDGRGDFLVPWHEPPGWRKGEGGGGDDDGEPASPPAQPPPVAWRFYHCYEGPELREDGDAAARTVEGARVERVFLDRGNWCVVVRRD